MQMRSKGYKFCTYAMVIPTTRYTINRLFVVKNSCLRIISRNFTENEMNEKDTDIMKTLHVRFAESIDPTFLVDEFYCQGIFTGDECLEFKNTNRPVSERAFKLLYLLPGKLESIDMFQKVLEDSGYDFLAKEIEERKIQHIPRLRKCTKFGTPELVMYRHKLKRLTHKGKYREFFEELRQVEKQWREVDVPGMCVCPENKRRIADRYFYALDAYCEYRRLINDKEFYQSDVFQKIQDLSKFTSETNVLEMLCLARYGSALFVANKDDFEKAHGFINEARHKFAMVKACRETGVVLYIEYNMFHIIYSKSMSYANKQHLLDLGHRAVEHFKAEAYDNPDVTNDFERMFSLKITHLYLGIGLFGNFLGHKISDADLRQAKYLLTRIETNDEQWGRLEVRWKWFYYIAKARVYFLENDIHGAVENAKKALSCAKEGRYGEEVKCTKKTYLI